MLKEKRKRDEESAVAGAEARKRAKSEEARQNARNIEIAKKAALDSMQDMLADATIVEYQQMYGDRWEQALEMELTTLEKGQDAAAKLVLNRRKAEVEWERREAEELAIRGLSSRLEFEVKP